MKLKQLPLLILILLFTSPCHAHDVAGNGFMAGLMHPVFGLDHLLAMISVGMLSVQIGGRAIWSVPAAFVAVMTIGGILGICEFNLPLVEFGIALSVLVLGTTLALDKSIPLMASMTIVAFFALFHGHAHGTEMPYVAQPAMYAMGFVLSTILIHITGVTIGIGSQRLSKGALLLRIGGVGIAGSGIYYLLA